MPSICVPMPPTYAVSTYLEDKLLDVMQCLHAGAEVHRTGPEAVESRMGTGAGGTASNAKSLQLR